MTAQQTVWRSCVNLLNANEHGCLNLPQFELGEQSASELARSLGVKRNKLYRWQDGINRLGDGAFPRSNAVASSAEDGRTKQLEKELAKAREEIEILKKATACFARELK